MSYQTKQLKYEIAFLNICFMLLHHYQTWPRERVSPKKPVVEKIGKTSPVADAGTPHPAREARK